MPTTDPSSGAAPVAGTEQGPPPAAQGAGANPLFVGTVVGVFVLFIVIFVIQLLKNRRMKARLAQGGVLGKAPPPDDEQWPGLGPKSDAPAPLPEGAPTPPEQPGPPLSVDPMAPAGATPPTPPEYRPPTPPEQPALQPFIIGAEVPTPREQPAAVVEEPPPETHDSLDPIRQMLAGGPSPDAAPETDPQPIPDPVPEPLPEPISDPTPEPTPSPSPVPAAIGADHPLAEVAAMLSEQAQHDASTVDPQPEPEPPPAEPGPDAEAEVSLEPPPEPLPGGPLEDEAIDPLPEPLQEEPSGGGTDDLDPIAKILAGLEEETPEEGAQPAERPDLENILARAATPDEMVEKKPDIEGILARAAPAEEEAASAAPVIFPEASAAEPLAPEDEELRQFEELYAADPSNTSLLDYLAAEYFQKEYVRRAQAAYEKLLEFDQTRADVWQNLSACQLELGLTEDAQSSIEKLLALPSLEEEVLKWAQLTYKELTGQGPQAPTPARPAPAVESARTEPGFRPEIEQKSKALSSALERREILTVYGGTDDTGLDSVREQLEQDPDNHMLLDWYAFLLYQNNRLIECIQSYRRLVTDFQPTPNALYYLGNAYLKLFKYRDAKDCWDRLKEEFVDSPLVAKAAKKLDRIQALARKELERRKKMKGKRPPEPRRGGGVGRISPKRVPKGGAGGKSDDEPLSAIGAILERHAEELSAEDTQPIFTEYVMGDGTGVDEVEALLQTDPDNVELLDWAAFMNYTNGNYDRSLEQYLKTMKLNPGNPQAYYYVGSIYYRLERFHDAAGMWQKLLDDFPDHKVTAKARSKLDQITARLKDAPKAAAKAEPEPAPEKPAGKSRVQAVLAKMTGEKPTVDLDEEERKQLFTQYAQGDGSGAEEIEALLSQDPDNVQLLDWAAFMNYTAGRLDKALEQYERVLSLDEKSPQALYYVGSILARMERYQEAVQHWGKLVEAFPDHKVSAKTRPKLEKLEKLVGSSPAGEPPKSKAKGVDVLLAQTTRPLDEDERKGLVRRSGLEPSAALKAVLTKLKKASDDLELLDWAGYLCYTSGKSKKALSYFAKVLKLKADSPQAYYYVGTVLCQDERFSDAAKYWKILVSKYGAHKLAVVTKPNLEKLSSFTGA